jgi:hypothetical protein
MLTRVDVLFERDLLPSAPNGGLVNAAELVNPAKVTARRFNIEKFKSLNDLAEVCFLLSLWFVHDELIFFFFSACLDALQIFASLPARLRCHAIRSLSASTASPPRASPFFASFVATMARTVRITQCPLKITVAGALARWTRPCRRTLATRCRKITPFGAHRSS